MTKSPLLALLLAWLLPGAGHWYVGQRWKAVIFCFLLVGLLVLGVLLTGGGCVNVERHPWALILQGCEGLATGVMLLVTMGAQEVPASKLNGNTARIRS